MGFFSKLFGGGLGPKESVDAGELLRSLSPEQQRAFADKANGVIETIVGAQREHGEQYVLGHGACLFILRNSETIGIVGNPMLFQQIAQTNGNPFEASIFLKSLKSYVNFVRAPSDRTALAALAAEAVLMLLSGRNEVCN